MKSRILSQWRVVFFAVVCMSLMFSGSAFSAGFALVEQGVKGLGNAYAGGAAGAEDAATIFFNPAGMTRLGGNQFIFASHLIMPYADFDNDGSTHVTGAPLRGDDDGNGADAKIIPNMYYAKKWATAFLLDTIYATPTYLNGGATIVRNDRIAAARVLLPLSRQDVLRPRHDRTGARHLAAVVLTESTDAVCVVLSEETGQVSIATEGHLRPVEDLVQGEQQLSQLLRKASKRALRMPRHPIIDEVQEVVARFTRSRVGSLLVSEGAVSLQPYVDRAVRIDPRSLGSSSTRSSHRRPCFTMAR